ncbi:MAG: hypothetical protein WEG36_05340 [Gemmatimonadota bacterium]
METTFLDHDSDEIHLGGEFTANATASPAGVIAIASHGDHLDIEALSVGNVQVTFQLYHGIHSDWDAGPIGLAVTAN